MNKEGTKVSIITKSLINDLLIEINESNSPDVHMMSNKLKVIRFLVDAHISKDARITDDVINKIMATR
jgi:hypothetical protein